MGEFLTQVAPGVSGFLLAVAALIWQYLKNQQQKKENVEIKEKAEQATLSARDMVTFYESRINVLRNDNEDLTKKVERAERLAQRNSGLIRDLNDKIEACEHKSAELEDKVRLKDARMAVMIGHLEELTDAIKARGVKATETNP